MIMCYNLTIFQIIIVLSIMIGTDYKVRVEGILIGNGVLHQSVGVSKFHTLFYHINGEV